MTEQPPEQNQDQDATTSPEDAAPEEQTPDAGAPGAEGDIPEAEAGSEPAGSDPAGEAPSEPEVDDDALAALKAAQAAIGDLNDAVDDSPSSDDSDEAAAAAALAAAQAAISDTDTVMPNADEDAAAEAAMLAMLGGGGGAAPQAAAPQQAPAAPSAPPGPQPEAFTPPVFQPTAWSGQNEKMELLRDVDLSVTIELGRTRMYVEDVLKLGDGAVVELDKLAGDPVDVFVNGRHIARGEVLVLNDNFCVRVNEIVDPDADATKKERH